MQLADRMNRILIETAFEVLLKARNLEAQGKNIVHLEIGEPDFPTPAHVITEGKNALDQGWTHYGPTQGYPEMRQSIARHISQTRGITAGPEHVCVVPGGKPSVEVLCLDANALLFVKEAYKHGKAIAASGDGAMLIAKAAHAAGMSQGEFLGPGVITASSKADTGDFLDNFIAAIARHRFPERPDLEAIVA